MSTKYRLELVKLHCTRLQDSVTKDEPQIDVNGVRVYGPGSIGKGDTVYLSGHSATFVNTAQVHLVEVDSGPDDDMGTVTIKGATDIDRGDQKREFHRTNSDYELTYRVVAA